MAATSSRTLRLLALLQTHRHWAGPELAVRLEVSPRTLRRDVDRLRDLGYPVQATPGVDGGYQLAAGAVLPPLVVDDEEAVALAVGMQAAAQGGALQEASLRALTKVVQVMPPRLRARVDALVAVTVPGTWGPAADPPIAVDPAALIATAQACRDTVRLTFAYAGRSSPQTIRYVEPLRLVPLGRYWYLVAYDLDRHDWRSFRLDRLTVPRLTTERFRPRELPAADAAAFVRAGMLDAPATHAVVVAVAAPAAVVADRLAGWATAEPTGPSTCMMRMRTDSLPWAAFALGLLDEPFEILSPPELRALCSAWAARFRGAGQDAPRTQCGA